MEIKVKLDLGAKMPNRAYSYDAGMDLFSRTDCIIPPGGSAIFDTGVHVDIPKQYAGFLKSKSGLNVKHNIVSEGVIDSGYTGSIVAKLYNLGDTAYEVKAGDKITQLVILPVFLANPIEVESIEDFSKNNQTGRNSSGFGSTGKQ